MQRRYNGSMRSLASFSIITADIFLILFPLAPIGPAPSVGASYVVGTVAGSEPPRDAALTVETWLDRPRGVAADAAGNVYATDSNYRIIRIKPDGTQENYSDRSQA